MRAVYVRTWLVLIGLCVSPWLQAAVTADMQKIIRANTFEVVAKKPELDPLTYEKPLPLDLIPFVQRNDPYQSIGTAFSLGRNTYITASHVLSAGIDSQFGTPSLRAADGKVYAIGRIHKFSAHEDFVVFSLTADVAPAGLPVNRAPQIDDAVLAVGNALGDGVVIRDGLFTSETPEDQDGRWKWIRFSAAASPGNSGGPLLDTEGRVIGVVVAKSPNENLNFALPIGRVMDSPEGKGLFDQRVLIGLPFIRGTRTFAFKDELKLPLDWKDFARSYQTLIERHNERARADLLETFAASIFPNGSGTEAILYGVNAYYTPRLIIQQPDLSWTSLALEYISTDLPGDGVLKVASITGGALVHLMRSHKAADDAFYTDSKAFMDIALKGLNLTRPVGPDQVRITSLGSALSETLHTDRWGRKWQQRLWSLPFMDVYVVGFLLPTPDGYVASIGYSPSGTLSEVVARQQLLLNQVDFSYLGRIDQWHAFLQRRALLPEALHGVKLNTGKEWRLSSSRFEFGAPPELIKIDDNSELGLIMAFMSDHKATVWDVAGARWNQDTRHKAYLSTWRQPLPPESAQIDLRNTFTDMHKRRDPYNAQFDRDSSDSYRISLPVEAPGSKADMISSDLIYALTLRVEGTQPMIDRRTFLSATSPTLKILERGNTEEPATNVPSINAQAEQNGKIAFEEYLKQSTMKEPWQGQDIRGRHLADDLRQHYFPLFMKRFVDGTDPSEEERDVLAALFSYWDTVDGLTSNRDTWASFLTRNELDPQTRHEAAIEQLEKDLFAALAEKPTTEWSQRARALQNGLLGERRNIAMRVASERKVQMTARQSDCPPRATATSMKPEPVIGHATHSPDNFYPDSSKRRNQQGLVILSLRVDSFGCATHAGIAASSGHEELDNAALRWHETIQFLPAEENGEAIAADKQLAVNFLMGK